MAEGETEKHRLSVAEQRDSSGERRGGKPGTSPLEGKLHC